MMAGERDVRMNAKRWIDGRMDGQIEEWMDGDLDSRCCYPQ